MIICCIQNISVKIFWKTSFHPMMVCLLLQEGGKQCFSPRHRTVAVDLRTLPAPGTNSQYPKYIVTFQICYCRCQFIFVEKYLTHLGYSWRKFQIQIFLTWPCSDNFIIRNLNISIITHFIRRGVGRCKRIQNKLLVLSSLQWN